MSTITFDVDDSLQALVTQEHRRWLDQDLLARVWMADATVWTGADEADWLGWLDIAHRQLERIGELEDLATAVQARGITTVVVLGMGGSSLSCEVFASVFPAAPGKPRLLIHDATDPAQLHQLADSLELRATLFVEASKSGSTLEPTIFGAYFRDRVEQALGSAAVGDHFIAITDPGSRLEGEAGAHGYLTTLFGLASIGGRFSALSDFGIAPAAMSGAPVRAILENAAKLAGACRAATDHNPALHLGLLLGTAAQQGRDKLTVLSSPALHGVGAWLEQLLAESTGKDGKGIIPVDREPVTAPVHYGDDRVFVHLSHLGETDDWSPTLDGLRAAGHPVVRIVLEHFDELGAEMFRWELATAIAGAVLGINPFNQPDVEQAKVATKEVTQHYERTGELEQLDWLAESGELRLWADAANSDALRALAHSASLEDLVLAHLQRTMDHDYLALLAYLPMTHELEALLTDIRVAVRDVRRVATCVGFGPRFQHSTGQVYKGGPNTGVFVQLTCRDERDAPVPGHRYTFGIVKEAQARGDLQVLNDRHRRAVRLDLGRDPAAGLLRLRQILVGLAQR